MIPEAWQGAFLVAFLACSVVAHSQASGVSGMHISSATSIESLFVSDSSNRADFDLFMLGAQGDKGIRQAESPSNSVSQLDLKAPRTARREYEKGLQLFIQKQFKDSIGHFVRSTTIYPEFVAAHNAIGLAFMALAEKDQAQKEFAQAVALDDHLPNSYLNLGRAEFSLQHYPAAQESLERASSISPLDLHLLTTLTYFQFLNHDYGAVIASAHHVHSRKHEGAAIVHYLAAAAYQGSSNLTAADQELQTFLLEDPKSQWATPARRYLEQIRQSAKPAPPVTISYAVDPGETRPAPGELPSTMKALLQEVKERKQLAELEPEPAPTCETCGLDNLSRQILADVSPGPSAVEGRLGSGNSGWTLRKNVDEVTVFFAAMDHGKSVGNLTPQQVRVRDDQMPPVAITEFRNESQLPLRIGLVVDTSASVTNRFSFELRTAASFLRKVVTGKYDLAFVVGFANSVLLTQEFTSDVVRISHGINQLAPGGGTSAWDAVGFAVEKLATRPEVQPVARVLVVISDGDDNSSTISLKQAIEAAERAEVTVYTVSTREADILQDSALAGDHALKALAGRTGGVAFFPGSLGRFDHSLEELQQTIRSRYLNFLQTGSVQK